MSSKLVPNINPCFAAMHDLHGSAHHICVYFGVVFGLLADGVVLDTEVCSGGSVLQKCTKKGRSL
jgi:hypothetical protein